MTPLLIQIIGIIAGSLTTIAFLPQVLKIFRTKDTASLSLPTYVIYALGTLLWLLYGALQKDYIIVIFNIGSSALALMVIGYKLKYK